jgi:type II secretory pathway pseudopilin PulG
MNKGGQRTPNAGFTIVETLIVLAVTGSMLLIAMIFVGGRQNKTEFQTAINDLQQQIQQLVNESESGHYTNDNNFSCNGSGSLITLELYTATKEQGANDNCIFLGNVLQFGTGTGDDASTLAVIPVVGKQYKTGLEPIQLVSDAKPRAVFTLSDDTSPTIEPATQLMKYGLKIAAAAPDCPPGFGMCYNPVAGSTTPAIALGIIAGDSNYRVASPDGGNLKPGAQQFTLYGVQHTSPGQNEAAVATAMGDDGVSGMGIETAKSAEICIESGTTDQSGLFNITADWHVSLQIFKGKTCGA